MGWLFSPLSKSQVTVSDLRWCPREPATDVDVGAPTNGRPEMVPDQVRWALGDRTGSVGSHALSAPLGTVACIGSSLPGWPRPPSASRVTPTPLVLLGQEAIL